MKKILLIEDDEDIRTLLSAALSTQGYTVVSCINGLEGLTTLAEETSPFDLIIVDLMMPVMNGWEFLEKLDNEGTLAKLSVVVLSGMKNSDLSTELTKKVTFLQKPVLLHLLFATVERLFLATET